MRARDTGAGQRRRPNALGTTSVVALVLTALVAPQAAHATSSGIVGYSGKQPGVFCTQCHSGGDAPDVTLTGPTDLQPGATGTYVFTLHTTASRQPGAGFDIAASGGKLATGDTNEQLLGGELTHRRPKQVDAHGDAAWSFKWTAPTANGGYTLYAAGNSVNDNGQPSGDNAHTTTLAITVGTGPAPTATATPPPSPPATLTPSPTATREPDPTPTPTTVPTGTPTPTPTAVSTATPTGTPQSSVSGDANCDGVVSAADLPAVIDTFGSAPVECAGADANDDGVVDIEDLGEIIALAFENTVDR